MLDLRPACETCGTALPPDRPGAYICSFECTYCTVCAMEHFSVCPTCDGQLTGRPLRTGAALERSPPAHVKAGSAQDV